MLLLLLFVPLSLPEAAFAETIATYLTWMRDPTKTMTVQWVTRKGNEVDEVFYQKVGDRAWHIAVGRHVPMPKKSAYLIHRVELTGLDPGAVYIFRAGGWHESQRKFRTLPASSESRIRFVVGGDMYHDEIDYLVETNKQAAKTGPMFALVGGDISYSASHSPKVFHTDEEERWLSWLRAWDQNMVTPEGLTIPFVPAIGNHDVNGAYGQTPAQSPYFYSLFAFPGAQGYNVLDIGGYMSVIVLDTNHTHPVERSQSTWLERVLAQRKNVPYKFALYHVPAYPSVRKFTGENNVMIRKFWVPHFENYKLLAAFEHHEHAYKRTHPILKGKVNPEGVLYLGDGAWGVKKARKPKSSKDAWYLAFSQSARHFIAVTINQGRCIFEGIRSDGVVMDRYVKPKF